MPYRNDKRQPDERPEQGTSLEHGGGGARGLDPRVMLVEVLPVSAVPVAFSHGVVVLSGAVHKRCG